MCAQTGDLNLHAYAPSGLTEGEVEMEAQVQSRGTWLEVRECLNSENGLDVVREVDAGLHPCGQRRVIYCRESLECEDGRAAAKCSAMASRQWPLCASVLSNGVIVFPRQIDTVYPKQQSRQALANVPFENMQCVHCKLTRSPTRRGASKTLACSVVRGAFSSTSAAETVTARPGE